MDRRVVVHGTKKGDVVRLTVIRHSHLRAPHRPHPSAIHAMAVHGSPITVHGLFTFLGICFRSERTRYGEDGDYLCKPREGPVVSSEVRWQWIHRDW